MAEAHAGLLVAVHGEAGAVKTRGGAATVDVRGALEALCNREGLVDLGGLLLGDLLGDLGDDVVHSCAGLGLGLVADLIEDGAHREAVAAVFGQLDVAGVDHDR